MKNTEIDIIITIIAGIIVLLFFFIFILHVLLIYQKRKLLHWQQLQQMEENYGKEILKASLEIKEQTLRNISQEIHDNIGQLLSLANLNLSAIEMASDNIVQMRIDKAISLVSRSLESLRNLSKTMDADNIESLGLVELIKLQLDAIEKTGQYTTRLSIEGFPLHLETTKEIIAYRIMQETITNIIKHAKATIIDIAVCYQQHSFLVAIKDNGIGIKEDNITTDGAGLRNMMNRAKLIGGSILINSKCHIGTEVNLTIPI